ncbi:hypothetical protein JL722_5746 [Aureococcus anophagefferens]|nr:hypothetical protein JL722_5746 [Aureococcus anophagefferens]
MVGKSIAVRGTRTAPPSRRRRAAWQRAAIIESYELANPAMIDSGDVDVLLAKYAGGLGRLLQRVQVKYDLVALDGCLMYRKAPGARWKEVSAELHARGRLALYRCDDDEARRALRALAAFGGAADGVALPTGVSVVGWVDARTLASATARDEDGGRYPFVVQAGGETGLAVTLAARTSNERGAWLAALREVASYFRDLRREAGRSAARPRSSAARSPSRAGAGAPGRGRRPGAGRRRLRRAARDGAERAAAAVAGLARVAELDPSLLALVEGEAKAAAAAARALDEAAPRESSLGEASVGEFAAALLESVGEAKEAAPAEAPVALEIAGDEGPLGMKLEPRAGGFVVLAVEGAGAAAAAGVRAGDVVVAVAGRSLAAEDWPEAGPPGPAIFKPRPLRLAVVRGEPSRASLADAAASGAPGDDADAADEPRASLASAASSEPEHEHRPSFFYREQAPAAAEPAPPAAPVWPPPKEPEPAPKSTAVWPPPKAAEAPTVRESVDALAGARPAWPPPRPRRGAVGPAPRYGHWERESHSIWRGSVLLDGPPSDADENSDWGDDAIADDDDDAIGEPEDAGEDFAFDDGDDDALTHGGWSDVSSMPDDAEDELGRPSFARPTLDI